ncbi:MAG: hypothetical protein KA004_02900 [Verrucomicrobiales bacterium]|nr:hypothetical protein [Verrucomicrobiales bacterium]
MFQTTLPVLIIWNLCILLGFMGLIWTIKVWQQRRAERRALKYRICCVICGTGFDEFSSEPLVKCPQCGRLNERERVVDL